MRDGCGDYVDGLVVTRWAGIPCFHHDVRGCRGGVGESGLLRDAMLPYSKFPSVRCICIYGDMSSYGMEIRRSCALVEVGGNGGRFDASRAQALCPSLVCVVGQGDSRYLWYLLWYP